MIFLEKIEQKTGFLQKLHKELTKSDIIKVTKS